ncbi:hypothetical protein LTR02_005358 [Friedmanniomyces endolithicus]|nr:hypothetical protein LTR94_003314 [Friedmanniomyces endolithicus]KAK0783491.1 hypothetical protein LTR59_011754 [Friedmanniomyces endolithicus]KAK0813573.1 hypothetical protein LTR38_002921 [Friedmanniomyces endolithicus]KAK0907645.1 hypothetical protein LTR02_005358 [Friedmanniomyces endolithicus]
MNSQPPALTKATSNSIKASGSATQLSPAASRTEQFFSGGRYSTPTRGSQQQQQQQQTAPRSNQSGKPKHKTGKKFQQEGLLDDDERLAMQNIGRRGKQADITHLMNIALPPRPHQGQYHRHSYNAPRRGGGRGTPAWMGSGYHAVDKARYIHANYRFIVTPQGDYTAQAADADVHIDWASVLQIIASPLSQNASCPICLGEPVAPRMPKCGHIFCMPCLIRYMHSDGDNVRPAHEKKARWKKCPICEDSIYISETRPVRWYAGQEIEALREGTDVVLRLVKRKAVSTLAMPRESTDVVPKGESIPWYFAAEVMDYARVMKGSEEYMLQQYDDAIAAIQQQEKEDELMFGEDAEWTSRAVRMLNEAKEKMRGIGNPPAQPKKPEQQETKQDERPPIQFNDSEDGVPQMYLQQHASNAPSNLTKAPEIHDEPMHVAIATGVSDTNTTPKTLHEMRQRQNATRPEPAEYLFYQAPLHYYLSPLDIRILKAAFASYQHFPSSILPRVERISIGHVMDDELRRRIKYLGHLPYGCEVGFLECDWTDTVPPHILEGFSDVLDRRRKRHDEKEAREEKERVRIERLGEKELAHIRRARRVPGLGEDPTLSVEWEALPTSTTYSAQDTTGDGNEGAWAGSPPWPNRTTSGFASLASPSTSPTAHRTVWGTTAVSAAAAGSDSEGLALLPTDNEFRQRDDGWLQGWERDLLDEGLAASMRGVSLAGSSSDVHIRPGTGAGGSGAAVGGGKKGKKGKKITLMKSAVSILRSAKTDGSSFGGLRMGGAVQQELRGRRLHRCSSRMTGFEIIDFVSGGTYVHREEDLRVFGDMSL